MSTTRCHDRRPLIAAAIALGAFQVADVVTTRGLLHHGMHELNPLAGFLIAAGWLLLAKLALSLGLLGRFAKVRPTIALLCTTWAVVGMYGAVALGNSMALARLI